jgi:hypothetical protein
LRLDVLDHVPNLRPGGAHILVLRLVAKIDVDDGLAGRCDALQMTDALSRATAERLNFFSPFSPVFLGRVFISRPLPAKAPCSLKVRRSCYGSQEG